MSHPKGLFAGLSLALLLAGSSLVWAVPAEPEPAKKTPTVEVVFCLDTTGSMRELIDGAKQKIWAMSNQIASGKPTPKVKIGLVAYRDRKDAYVTQLFDLTDDLDAVHDKLLTFKAEGGGDEPESVNQALHEAVTKIKWSEATGTLKLIFLVGDAPPHMDYPDDVKYPDTCKRAAERGIIINTVLCGTNPRALTHWKEIADKAEGSFAQIGQKGDVAIIETPFDKDLAAINTELSKSILVFGTAKLREEGEAKKEAATSLPVPAAADRAGFTGKDGRAAAYDLLDAIKAKTVKLEDLKKEELPKELQSMTLEQQKKHLDELDKKRDELRKQALELDKKRGEFIAKKIEEEKAKGKKDGFDEKVLETLRKQAQKYKIDY